MSNPPPDPLPPPPWDPRKPRAPRLRDRKLDLEYQSPYDRPVTGRLKTALGIWVTLRVVFYIIYWLVIPVAILLLLLYVRSMMKDYAQ
jgi:hypothetical protein